MYSSRLLGFPKKGADNSCFQLTNPRTALTSFRQVVDLVFSTAFTFSIKIQARHDCEKIAIRLPEPASQDRSSQQSNALFIGPNGLFDITNHSTYH